MRQSFRLDQIRLDAAREAHGTGETSVLRRDPEPHLGVERTTAGVGDQDAWVVHVPIRHGHGVGPNLLRQTPEFVPPARALLATVGILGVVGGHLARELDGLAPLLEIELGPCHPHPAHVEHICISCRLGEGEGLGESGFGERQRRCRRLHGTAIEGHLAESLAQQQIGVRAVRLHLGQHRRTICHLLVGPRGELLRHILGLEPCGVQREVHAEVSFAGAYRVVVLIRGDRALAPVGEGHVRVRRLVLVRVDGRPGHVIAVRALEITDDAVHEHRRESRIADLRRRNLTGVFHVEHVAAAGEQQRGREARGPPVVREGRAKDRD